MTTPAQRKQHEQWLLELTGIPTAAGKEERVINWIRAWVEKRKGLKIKTDRAGNLFVSMKRGGGTSGGRNKKKPLLITAHLDHPAFVVRRLIDKETAELEFRGGVHNPYFEDARIEIFAPDDTVHRAVLKKLAPEAKPFKRVIARLENPRTSKAIQPGDIGRWRFTGRVSKPIISGDRLQTNACDDLAAAAAALAAFDLMRRRKGFEHVGLLFTRAEEIGFVGTLAACVDKSIPKTARLLCLENSRSFPESPIGAGPILRVGDKMSVFGPDLTNRIDQVLTKHQKRNPSFKYQRKLMPGGTCEATAFSTWGWLSTCLCLPLENYHNMHDIDGVLAGKRPARVAPESISINDYHGLIEMLIAISKGLDDPKLPTLKSQLQARLKKFGKIVYESK